VENKEKLNTARKLFKLAYKLHMAGDINEAIKAYRHSIHFYPTAKAHTFLGWAYSVQGKHQAAIDECLTAIELDPDYGNPYNDIGMYLFQMKKFVEAIIWFEKALNIPGYKSRHFPLYNLAKIYEKKGDWTTALQYYNDALEFKPDYEPAKAAAMKLMAAMN
jgi:Tfp pilus assembly protein PilF